MLRWISIFSLFCIVSAYADTPSATKKSELNALNQNIASVQQDLKQSSIKKSELQTALAQTEATENKLNQHVKHVQKKIAQQKKQLQVLQQQAIPLQQQKIKNRELLKQQIRTAYLLSQQPYLKAVLSPNDVAQTNRTLTYFRYIANAQLQTMDKLEQSIVACKANQTAIQKKYAQLVALKQTQVSNQQAIQKTLATKQVLINTINQQIQTKSQKLAALLANKKSLEKTIARLTRPSSSTSNQKYISNKPFARLRGRLPWPVKGSIRHAFGTQIDQSELKWDGELIDAPLGQQVRAVADGRVIFAKWMAGYGLLLIIDNGSGYMTLYGRNQTISEHVGDTVKAGDVIATVGKSGGFDNPGLYFSIRHNTQALNPAHWCR